MQSAARRRKTRARRAVSWCSTHSRRHRYTCTTTPNGSSRHPTVPPAIPDDTHAGQRGPCVVPVEGILRALGSPSGAASCRYVWGGCRDSGSQSNRPPSGRSSSNVLPGKLAAGCQAVSSGDRARARSFTPPLEHRECGGRPRAMGRAPSAAWRLSARGLGWRLSGRA